MKTYIALMLALASCGKAVDNARAIDPKALCVNRADDMAYCFLNGRPYICDNTRCLPLPDCPIAGAVFPIVESSGDDKDTK